MDITYLGYNNLELGVEVDEWERTYIHHIVLTKVEGVAVGSHERIIESLEETGVFEQDDTAICTVFGDIKNMLFDNELEASEIAIVMDAIAA